MGQFGVIGNPTELQRNLFLHGNCWILAVELARLSGGSVWFNDLHAVAQYSNTLEYPFVDILGVYRSLDDVTCGSDRFKQDSKRPWRESEPHYDSLARVCCWAKPLEDFTDSVIHTREIAAAELATEFLGKTIRGTYQ